MQHPTPRLGSEPVFESLRRWVPNTLLAPSEGVPLRDAMDAAGARLGFVCAWWGPRGPLIDNDEVAGFIREYPDRLKGVAGVDLGHPIAAVRELRRAVREPGFRALRILPWLWNLPPNDRRYYPLYAECVELDIPVCLQVGHTGPLAPSEPGRPIPILTMWHEARHPFGKIPAFEHAGFRLYEAGAITRYVDEAFPGHRLQPDDACGRARTNQIISILDSYAYRTLVWDIYVERVTRPAGGAGHRQLGIRISTESALG